MAFVNATPLTARTNLTGRTLKNRSPSRNPQATRMIAVEPKAPTKLSNRATQLRSYIRAHKSIFRPGRGFTSTHATLFRKNDTGRCFTPLDELATNAHVLPAGSVAATMLVQAEDHMEKAKQAGISNFPVLEADEVLMDIFEHDMRFILRVISFGAACQSSDFIHSNNMGIMKMQHEEVGFPAGLIVDALRVVKDEVLGQVTDASLIDGTAECFDVVISFMS